MFRFVDIGNKMKKKNITLSGYGFFFLKKYSDFGGRKKNNLVQSFCHIT